MPQVFSIRPDTVNNKKQQFQSKEGTGRLTHTHRRLLRTRDCKQHCGIDVTKVSQDKMRNKNDQFYVYLQTYSGPNGEDIEHHRRPSQSTFIR